MHMSKQGIYDQLISEYGEQFTEEEAQYAVDNLKADYKENTLQKAKSYQDSLQCHQMQYMTSLFLNTESNSQRKKLNMP